MRLLRCTCRDLGPRFATVRESEFSGAGHRIGNLLPCCKPCNSKKGNLGWEAFIASREVAGSLRDVRVARIRRYLDKLFVADSVPSALPEYARFLEIRDEVLRLMKEADTIASGIRLRMKEANKCTADKGGVASRRV